MFCSVPKCNSPIKYKGLCGMHYKRQWRHGDVNQVYVINTLPKIKCTVVDCVNEISHSAGLCKLHEQRFRRYGRLENILAPKGSGGFNSDGYYMLTINGIRVYEHRYNMENHLGRKLLSTEIVHHIDGNRWNNDISNLELLESQSEHMKKHANN